MRSPFAATFAVWFKNRRLDLHLNRREIALLVGIDNAYVTVIEQGYVPSRAKTAQIGIALGARDEALVHAGYVPEPTAIRRFLREQKAKPHPVEEVQAEEVA